MLQNSLVRIPRWGMARSLSHLCISAPPLCRQKCIKERATSTTLITPRRDSRFPGSARLQPHPPGSAAAASSVRAWELQSLLGCWPLPGMLSERPGSQLSRGRDRFSRFSRLPRDAGEGRLETVSALFSGPSRSLCSLPHCKMLANQDPGAGLWPSRPPSGLIESYIKKFSSERGEEREKERGAEEKGKRRVREVGRRASVSEARKSSRIKNLSGNWHPGTTARKISITQLWRFLPEVRDLSSIAIGCKW